MNKAKTQRNTNRLVVTGGSDGGPTTYTGILEKHLPQKGIDVEIIPFDKAKGPKGIKHLSYILNIMRASSGEAIIYARDPVSTGFPALLASKIKRKPLVLKVVGDYAWEQGRQRFGVEDGLDIFLEKKNYSLRVKFLRFIQKAVAEAALKIIVPSNYLRNVVGSWGVDENKIEVIPNSFNAGVLPKENKKELRKELNFGDKKIFISAGRMVPWKGFGKLLEAYERIGENFPRSKLIIVGDGPLFADIEEKASVSKGNIKIIKKLSHPELMKHIKAADIFVLNSGYEGMSHLLLEASALGTPIATTANGGNIELLEGGKTAVFFEYDNARDMQEKISALLNDEKAWKKLSSEALKLSESYTEGKMIDKIINVLEDIYDKTS